MAAIFPLGESARLQVAARGAAGFLAASRRRVVLAFRMLLFLATVLLVLAGPLTAASHLIGTPDLAPFRMSPGPWWAEGAGEAEAWAAVEQLPRTWPLSALQPLLALWIPAGPPADVGPVPREGGRQEGIEAETGSTATRPGGILQPEAETEPRSRSAGSEPPDPTVVAAGTPWIGPTLTPLPAVPVALRPLKYRVAEGDTLLAIALRFGITPETVLWANDLGNGELIYAGQELTVLPVSGVLHRVQKGDSLSGIAGMYGADPALIARVNLPADPNRLEEGSLLIVPGGLRRTTEPITGLPPPPSPEELENAPRYVVEAGDTLVSIADAFSVRPSAIQVANGLLDPDLLRVGQRLAIPGGRPSPSKPRAATPAPAPSPTAAAPAPSPQPTAAGGGSGAPLQYTVKPGDTLYSIARSFGVPVSALQAANGMENPNALRAGQRLSIPGGRDPGAAGDGRSVLPGSQPVATATAAPAATPPPPTPTRSTTAAPTATAAPAPPTPTAPASRPPVSSSPRPAVSPPSSGSRGDRIAGIAQKYLGYRYLWGGHSPQGFDCTGLTWYVYREAGVSIPLHDLEGQMRAGPPVERSRLLPGDLVFFKDTYKPGLSHSGIYLGGNRFINAETESVGVQIRSLSDPFWSSRFVGASRPW